MFLPRFALSLLVSLAAAGASFAQQPPVTWTTDALVLESGPSSWTRMIQLKDGSWLAGYMFATTPTRIRIKRSFDHMRTWQFVTEITEEGRDLDNPTFCLLPDGSIILGLRTVIFAQSYVIETYRSTDNGTSFQYQSFVDWDHHIAGVFEPYLYVLPDGNLAIFYTSEIHQQETPSYSQILAEKVSTDGGFTWGPEIFAISQPGKSRPGEANIVPLPGNVLALFYEICGSENCVGHVSYSTDGVTWPGIGPALPSTFEDVQAVGIENGLLFATSNGKAIIMSQDYSNTWIDTRQRPFAYGSWPGLYRTAQNEIALVYTGGGDHGELGQYIRFGTINPSAYEPVNTPRTCGSPTLVRPQNCF